MRTELTLSDASRLQFQTTGWTLAPQYIPADALPILRSEAEKLSLSTGAQDTCQYYVDQWGTGETRLARIERIVEHLPIFHSCGLAKQLAQDAALLLNGPVVAFKDKLNIRYPNSAGYAPHQDAARWHRFGPRFVSFGLFLSGSTPDQGGFSFADYDLDQGLKATRTGDFDAVSFEQLPRHDVIASAGDVLIIDGAVPHCTTQNLTGGRVLHVLITFVLGTDKSLRDAYYASQESAFEQVREGNVFTFPAR
ncbi:MAG: phytanoyl-CoA dioxygenase family protein [Sulfitobacter sp.]